MATPPTVYRGLTRNTFDGVAKKPRPSAFFRRPRDTDGVSIGTSVAVVAKKLSQCERCAELVVEDVRGIEGENGGDSLDVEMSNSEHGAITNVPYYDRENPAVAERIGRDLAEISRISEV